MTVKHSLAAAILLMSCLWAGTAQARPPLLRGWLQTHTVTLAGHGNYFDARQGPYFGWGAQVGVSVLVFEAYADLNAMQWNLDAPEGPPTLWGEVGGGLNIPFNFHEKIGFYLRGDVAWVYAPYHTVWGRLSGSGFTSRGGVGIEYLPSPIIGVGGAVYGGYHILGLHANGDNGYHILGQIYVRLILGL